MNNEKIEIAMPKNIAKITVCGCLTIMVNNKTHFVMPTEEQRKNLKEMLCIDVEPLQEDIVD